MQWAGPRRMAPAPCAVADLPRIDAVLLSHNHYDHLDADSVAALAGAHPRAVWFTPTGNAAYIAPLGVSRVVELDWWASGALLSSRRVVADGNDGSGLDTLAAETEPLLQIICTPAQHISGA